VVWPEPFARKVVDQFRHAIDTGEPYSAPITFGRQADGGPVKA
jgi:hypothetical protein